MGKPTEKTDPNDKINVSFNLLLAHHALLRARVTDDGNFSVGDWCRRKVLEALNLTQFEIDTYSRGGGTVAIDEMAEQLGTSRAQLMSTLAQTFKELKRSERAMQKREATRKATKKSGSHQLQLHGKAGSSVPPASKKK